MTIIEAIKSGKKFRRHNMSFWNDDLSGWMVSMMTLGINGHKDILATDWEVLVCEKCGYITSGASDYARIHACVPKKQQPKETESFGAKRQFKTAKGWHSLDDIYAEIFKFPFKVKSKSSSVTFLITTHKKGRYHYKHMIMGFEGIRPNWQLVDPMLETKEIQQAKIKTFKNGEKLYAEDLNENFESLRRMVDSADNLGGFPTKWNNDDEKLVKRSVKKCICDFNSVILVSGCQCGGK